VRVWRGDRAGAAFVLRGPQDRISQSYVDDNNRVQTSYYNRESSDWEYKTRPRGVSYRDISLFKTTKVDDANDRIRFSDVFGGNEIKLPIITLETMVAEACRLAPGDLSDEQKEAFFVTEQEPVCSQTNPIAGVAP
jgi:hypothetical protein